MTEMKVVELESQDALSVSATVGTMGMPGLMGRTYAALSGAVVGKEGHRDDSDSSATADLSDGPMPVGFPYCIYRQIEWEKVTRKNPFAMFHMMFFKKWHIEMGMAAGPGASAEGADRTTFPGGRYLRTVHKGPYSSVGKSYARMWQYIQENQLKCDNFSIERYLNDPRSVPSTEIQTELLVPLR
jgi:hypothetical protein